MPKRQTMHEFSEFVSWYTSRYKMNFDKFPDLTIGELVIYFNELSF